MFWAVVARRQLLGLKFRQQHGIGRYIVDLYCPQKKLIIEIDGDSHFQEGARERDEARTIYLQSLGYTIVRYTNIDVVHNLPGVVEDLLRRISVAPSTSPTRAGVKK